MWRVRFACVVCVYVSACQSAEDAALPVEAGSKACELDTGFPGDEYCLPPPPPDQGFQIHIGPSDYDNPGPEFLLQPNQEVTTNFQVVSGNDEPVFFYYRQYRMRPGTHHNIVGTVPAGGLDIGRRLAITNHLIEDNPKGGMLAPENSGIGIPLDPNTPLVVDVHSINVTDAPALREVWINFWYREPSEVTETVLAFAHPGDTTFAIAPRADTMLGPYRCQVFGEGRILWMYGHRHANNQRFTAWRIRGAERTLLYESYNWEDPLLLEFSSTVQNPVADRAKQVEGGYSGVLDLRPGDQLEWECHVVNQTDGYLRFTNENFTGEMCILDAELVGAGCL